MRAVWVVEWQAADGGWWVWNGQSPMSEDRREAWHGLRKARENWPNDTFRVTKYVPAIGPAPAQRRAK